MEVIINMHFYNEQWWFLFSAETCCIIYIKLLQSTIVIDCKQFLSLS
jgi:hypothetical protein